MSEPKLTVGRVETWRPIDAENVLFRAGLQDDHTRSQRAAGYVRAAMRELVRELNGRLAPPAPQPEAKAGRDGVLGAIDRLRNRAVAAAGPSDDRWQDAEDDASVIEARIAELVRERDEARAKPRDCETCWDSGYREGAAAAKEACAKRLEDKADHHSDNGNPIWFTISQMFARIIRETEVPDA